MDSDEGRDYLISLRLLDESKPHEEWNAMVPGDRHSTVFWWLQLTLVELEQSKVLHVAYLQLLSGSICKMRAMANDLMSCLDRDKPFPYTALCGVLVFFNVLIMSTWKGVNWSTWLFSFGTRIFWQPRMYVDMAVLLTWNLSYAALYDLGYMLQNPFGSRRIDVAHETISLGIRKLSTSLVSAIQHIPPFLKKAK